MIKLADFDLDYKFPILLFPIRIETKYHDSGTAGLRNLKIRFFPDQIAINNFEPRLTIREKEDARNYWVKVSGAEPPSLEEVRNSAWAGLAGLYGLPRAAYISKAVIKYDPSDPDFQADPVHPTLKDDAEIKIRDENEPFVPFSNIMPTRFFIYAKFKDGTPALDPLDIEVGNDIPDPLQIDPFQLATDPDTPNWIRDFEVAKDMGMAFETEMPLTLPQYERGFEYIIVYGVKTGQTPDEIKGKIEELFRAHHYTSGFSFVKQGTPTNRIKQDIVNNNDNPIISQPPSVQIDNVFAYRRTEFSSIDAEASTTFKSLSPDGTVFEKTLGLEGVAQGTLNANNRDQINSSCVSALLWPVVAGYFLKTFTTIPSLNVDKLQEHFIKYVCAQGNIPAIRVGKSPYGILPVTIVPEWKDTEIFQGKKYINDFLTKLIENTWAKSINDVPTVMNKTQQFSSSELLFNIFSMEAISHTSYVRGIRSLLYVTDLIFDVLRERLQSNLPIITYGDATNRDIRKKSQDETIRRLARAFGVSGEKIMSIGMISKLWDLPSVGGGITSMNFPLVTTAKDRDILEPNYLERMNQDIKEGGPSNFFKTTVNQTGIPGVEPSPEDPLLFRLLRYSASIVGQEGDIQKQIFRESLQNLQFGEKNPSHLERLMLQTLDLSSYRIDAWISSLANQKLDTWRQINKTGLYVGAFGWIQNLMPKKLQDGVSTKRSVHEGGFIQAPSNAQAVAAAVLRNGYLTHLNDPERKDMLKINLTSERTKRALELIDGIQKIPLSELLGYRLERRLHDSELDYLIDEFRKFFHINKDDPVELADDQAILAKERIEPRNLTDGFSVYKNWKRLRDSLLAVFNLDTIKDFMENDTIEGGWHDIYEEIKFKYAPTEEKINEIIESLVPHFNYLLDEIDGLSDLCLSESVYQAIKGNYSRSAAVMDGISGDSQIPVPEIASTPRSGPHQLQKVMLVTGVEGLQTLTLRNIDDPVSEKNPRKVAEPTFSKLCEPYISGISFWFDVKDELGNILSTEKIGLNELEVNGLDLLYIQDSELELRLRYYGKKRGHANFDVRYDDTPSLEDEMDTKSFADLEFLIKSLKEIVGQGQPLRYLDFVPGQILAPEVIVESIKEVFQRYYDINILLIKAVSELESVDNDEETVEALEKKRVALMGASIFGIDYAIPITSEGNVITSKDDLRNKIAVVIKDLKSRVLQYDTLPHMLLKWKSNLEDHGEEIFLEEIINELSTGSDSKTKYQKTLDILIAQIRSILNSRDFLILPPIPNPSNAIKKLSSSAEINRKALKWIEKASFVRPRLKLLDEIIMQNEIFNSAYFTFYYDVSKFMVSAEKLEELAAKTLTTDTEDELTSRVLVLSTKTGEEQNVLAESQKLAGFVSDEWTDKIVSKNQDTAISFHYDGPSAEAPQSLLLVVSPTGFFNWNSDTLLTVIRDTLRLAKIRAVDYRSLKGVRQFLPLSNLNAYGSDIFVNLFDRGEQS